MSMRTLMPSLRMAWSSTNTMRTRALSALSRSAAGLMSGPNRIEFSLVRDTDESALYPAKYRHTTAGLALFTTAKKSKGPPRDGARHRTGNASHSWCAHLAFGRVCDASHSLTIFCQTDAVHRRAQRQCFAPPSGELTRVP